MLHILLSPGQWRWDLIVWPMWLVLFLAFEIPGILRHIPFTNVKVPWTSLSRFVWRLDSINPVVPYLVLIGMAVLLVHFVTGFPGKG